MSVAELIRRALVDGDGAEVGARRAGDHFRGDGVEVGALAQLEQLAQVVGALRLGAFLLQAHLHRLQFLLERGVFLLDLLQRDVAGPHAARRRR